jgi:glycerol-3-phosphate dehydrogenase (NAD+)
LQVAVPNLSEAVQDADLLVFVIPHQFIHKICDEITGRVPEKALGITLIKVGRRAERRTRRVLGPGSS